MTEVRVRMSDRGQLRLFTIAEGQADLLALLPDPPTRRAGNPAALLGVDTLPQGSADLIRIDDISALGLCDFLIEGHDVIPDSLDEDAGWLDALRGHVLLVHASVAQTADITLRPRLGVTLAGTFPIAAAPLAPIQIPGADSTETLGGVVAPSGPHSGKGGAVVVLILVAVVALVLLLLGVRLGLPPF